MFTCKICGRNFKSIRALGGHTSHAHPNTQSGEVSISQGAENEMIKKEFVASGDDESESAAIMKYARQCYSFEQLTKVLGFKPSTVRDVLAKMIPPTRNGEQSSEASSMPVTVKGTEAVTPEFIMRSLADGSDDWRLRLEGMMLLRAAQKMNREDVEIMRMQAEADAKLLEPILRVMREAREEQDAAAARAKASSLEIAHGAAQEAAQEVAGNILTYLDQKIPKGPPPKDMNEMFTKRLDKLWEYLEHMMMSKIMPQQAANELPSGWQQRDVKEA